MKIQDVMSIFDYNYWANEKLLHKATKLSQEQYH